MLYGISIKGLPQGQKIERDLDFFEKRDRGQNGQFLKDYFHF
jgi:hypothetical protein